MLKALQTTVRRLPGRGWLVLALAFGLLVAADATLLGISKVVDQRGGDLMLRLDAKRHAPSDRVVIIDIDQRSLEMMNDMAGSWPWPRSVHGELIDYIAPQRPRAIAFDILFNEPDVYRPEHDAMFAEAVERNRNVWLAMALADDGPGARVSDMPATVGARPLIAPPRDARVPLLLPLVVATQPNAMRGGLINFTSDSDGVGRHHSLYRDRNGWRFPSLASRMMTDLGRTLPTQEQVLLKWRHGWKHISYADLYLDSMRQKRLRPADEFKGKIVLVGTSAPGLLDLRVTPLDSTYPGVEILATAIDNLDRGDWLREVSRSSMVPLSLILIALIAFAFARNISANLIGYALLALTALGAALAWAAMVGGVFVPLFAPLAFGWSLYLAGSALAYFDERTQRLRTSGMFKRFLDPRVVADLIERGEIDHRGSAESREVTVLFSDIRGFTALSEVAPAEEVVALLNTYFSKQVDVIFRHGGTLDKFIGDAIMAFWGAPVASADHARRAVDAAIEMLAALEDMRSQLGELGADLEIGIGVHTGRAVVGFIGSEARLDYTVIGDTVNLASRIEGMTKGVACILVSEAVRDTVGEAFDWRDHGSRHVKGRETPVCLFEPVSKHATPAS